MQSAVNLITSAGPRELSSGSRKGISSNSQASSSLLPCETIDNGGGEQVYTFNVRKRGRKSRGRWQRKRRLEVDVSHALLREYEGTGIKRSFKLFMIRGMERHGSASLRLFFTGGKKRFVSYRYETRASVEMFVELVLSIKEGPMRPDRIHDPNETPKSNDSIHGNGSLPAAQTVSLQMSEMMVDDDDDEDDEEDDDSEDDDEDDDEDDEDNGPASLCEEFAPRDTMTSAVAPKHSRRGFLVLRTSRRHNTVSNITGYQRQTSDPGALFAAPPELLSDQNKSSSTSSSRRAHDAVLTPAKSTPGSARSTTGSGSGAPLHQHQHHNYLQTLKERQPRNMPHPIVLRPNEVTIAVYTWNMGSAKPDRPDSWIVGSRCVPCAATTASSAGPVALFTGAASSSAGVSSAPASGGAGGSVPVAGKHQKLDDIIVVGVQEYMFDTGSTSTRQHWQSQLSEVISSRDEARYVCLTHVDSWNRMLSVYVREALVDRITHLKADTTHVGVGGVGVNKGAIGVRFTLYDTVFCFVNSHFAAHQNEVSKRNEDFADIMRGLRKLIDSEKVELDTSVIHHLVWMGDLNYRIDLERETVIDHIANSRWDELENEDQLHKQILDGRALYGFVEAPLAFPPTYKYTPGVYLNGLRQYSSEKNRIPAWCDRILLRTLNNVSSKILEYSDVACEQVLTSDHCPVYMRSECQLIHTTGLRGRDTLLRLSRDADLLYLKVLELVVKPLPKHENTELCTGDWMFMLASNAFADGSFRSTVMRDVKAPHWRDNAVETVRLLENKIELLAKKYVSVILRCNTGKGIEVFSAGCILSLAGCSELDLPDSSALSSASSPAPNPNTMSSIPIATTNNTSAGVGSGTSSVSSVPVAIVHGASSELAAASSMASSMLSSNASGIQQPSLAVKPPVAARSRGAASARGNALPGVEFHEVLLRNGVPVGVIDGRYTITRPMTEKNLEHSCPPSGSSSRMQTPPVPIRGAPSLSLPRSGVRSPEALRRGSVQR